MKRILTITFVLLLVATSAYAFGWGGFTEFIKGAGWGTAAILLTTLIGVAGLATRAKWASVLLIAIGALLHGIADIPTVIGIALQNGKVEGDELKKVWAEMTDVSALLSAFLTAIKTKPTDA